MKKAYFVIAIISLIACLTGIPYLTEGVSLSGLDGVNYGRIIFPLLISCFFFWLFKQKQ